MFQSVLSHTGGDRFERPLDEAAKALNPRGQILFTVLQESAGGFAKLTRDKDASGWQYPHCVTYLLDAVIDDCRQAGLIAQKLGWFHPSHWCPEVADDGDLLSDAQNDRMGRGRPLFDDRFR